MDSKQPEVVEGERDVTTSLLPPSAPELIAVLPPKGACWYCDKPLDAVRRFCGRNCSVAYAEEVLYQGE